MIEKLFNYAVSNDMVIEKVIEYDNLAINHMVLRKSEALPEHYSNSNVYMVVIRGQVTLRLDEQDEHTYPVGSIIIIPYKTKMNVFNQHDEPMEIFVVKAPNPKHMS
jgi:quercetin dioxygenase-like cupin family protein